ncbi:LysR family transcriptional regulator [Pelagibius sp. Alg239-R121]|uniref:LysR family transcriptional regulator n=1 Tax=Pelagibius sp. Alg239-R121 TaxID=2993448 RepID=UPI0024A6CEF4|nr:LysR family transcriptional regulator [Pelagibius sp. Alg239-R121]
MEFPAGFDLKSIRTFTFVVELGGMTQAAQRLEMTQSSVSQTIGNLEEALGAALFDRTVRPIALTPTGVTLYDHGRAILSAAGDTLQALREQQGRRLASLTLGMPESFANTVGPLLTDSLDGYARRWRVWSGISPENHDALMNHTVDIIVTTSDELDSVEGLEIHPLLEEPFILVFPATFEEMVTGLEAHGDLRFIRYSLRSAIGRQVERQINRLRLNLPITGEFDTASGQLAAVAAGTGWSVTTPLCLLQEYAKVGSRVRVEPIKRGQFSRSLKLVARKNVLGDVPRLIAAESRNILRNKELNRLFEQHAWIKDLVIWPEPDSI